MTENNLNSLLCLKPLANIYKGRNNFERYLVVHCFLGSIQKQPSSPPFKQLVNFLKSCR